MKTGDFSREFLCVMIMIKAQSINIDCFVFTSIYMVTHVQTN